MESQESHGSSFSEAKKKKKKLFYTTSDIMNTINKSIASVDSKDDAISPRVELQRRMPDGSTRPANDKDLEAADMESKLKQAAEQVAELTPKQKIEWAEQQRQEGNKLYKERDYRGALDVYLTCLVAKTEDADFTAHVFLPVMNNLAQCSLQLKMYHKAQQFCTLALEEIHKSSNRQEEQLVAKLYFRRGRAKRLGANYQQAKSDFEIAMSLLEKESTEYQTVQREMQLLQRAENEERRNEKRQERAMQRLLGSNGNEPTPGNGSIKTESVISDSKRREAPSRLYSDCEGNERTYSNLTARKRMNHDRAEQADSNGQSCWRWYIAMVGRGAEKLLILLGDEEYADRSANTDIAQQRKNE